VLHARTDSSGAEWHDIFSSPFPLLA